MKAIADGGAEAFYNGTIAEQIVAFSQTNGGFLSQSDFVDHTAEWVDPVSTNYRGYDMWELPPNGQGIAALQMLNLLEPYDLRSLGPGHPQYLHQFIEAKKLAFADRAKFYADPAMADVPVKELISKAYASGRGELIDRDKAAVDVPAGDPRLARGDTIYLTVVDKDRNCCSLIQSVYFGFGSQVTPGDVGFAMQNRGALFALDEKHANRLEPHKRPFHTIIPAMVTKDGKPWLSFGVMGGAMQPQGHVQVLIRMFCQGRSPQQALDAPRWYVAEDFSICLEPDLNHLSAELSARGHGFMTPSSSGLFGGGQIILRSTDGYIAGSDPRKDGHAAGF